MQDVKNAKQGQNKNTETNKKNFLIDDSIYTAAPQILVSS